jgi:hypothetical protein
MTSREWRTQLYNFSPGGNWKSWCNIFDNSATTISTTSDYAFPKKRSAPVEKHNLNGLHTTVNLL